MPLAAARAKDDHAAEDRALNNLGVVYGTQGRWAEAEDCYQQSLAIEREVGDHVNKGHTLGNLALLRRTQGEMKAAQKSTEASNPH